MSDEPKSRRPQVSAQLPTARLREQAVAIAAAKDERDEWGRGLNVVIRRAIADYVKRNRQHLPDELRD